MALLEVLAAALVASAIKANRIPVSPKEVSKEVSEEEFWEMGGGWGHLVATPPKRPATVVVVEEIEAVSWSAWGMGFRAHLLEVSFETPPAPKKAAPKKKALPAFSWRRPAMMAA